MSEILLVHGSWHGPWCWEEVRRTARAYRTEAEIFPGMGHDMMLDEDWCTVADRVDAWVRENARTDATGSR